MIKSITSAPQGNILESENQVTNPATATEQPVFAVTKGDIGEAHPATGEQIAKELTGTQLHDIVRGVRAENDEQKQKALKEQSKFNILGICPHFYKFRNNHRTQADAIAECCTYMTCIDVDNRDFGQKAIDGALRLNDEQGTRWYGKVLYIENSLRGGGKVHIWLACPLGMTIVETQEAFCSEIGIPCDSMVQQKQSFIMMTGDRIYQSESWLRPLTPDQIEAHREAFLLRGLGIDGWPMEKSNKQSVETTFQGLVTMPGDSDITVPNSRTSYIIDACLREAGLKPNSLQVEGQRHNSWKSIFSVGAVALLSKAEMQGEMRQRSPEYWQSANGQQLINDFYTKYSDASQRLNQFQRRTLAKSQQLMETDNDFQNDNTSNVQLTCDQLTLTEIYADNRPPRMNRKKMPHVVKAVTACTPKNCTETVAQACFPSLEAHPQGLSFRYTDMRPRELRGNCLTVSDTGSGKSCNDGPIEHIMADIKKIDEPNRKKLREYNEKFNIRNSNQDKPKRPTVVIRYLMPNLTQASLAQRTEEAQGAPLYCRLNEIEQFDNIENASRSKNQFTNLKINDDEGNNFGQERAGTQSVNAASSLFLNWNASTTPAKAIRYFRNVVVDGPISRLTLATIPDPGIGAPQPIFGNYDEKYDKALKPFIDNLNKATGYIDCRQARQMIQRLKAECDEFAIASQDRVFDNLTHRALVHVFRKACCIYAANGMKWERTIESWCRWSLHYDLWLKLHYFGDLIRKADENIPVSVRGPRNMLEQLNDEFTVNEVSDLRFLQGKNREGTANQIYQWVHRGLILHLTADKYKKIVK